jgi:hypothetical protein
MSKMYFAFFIAIVLSIYAGMHGFVYWRLVSGLALSGGQRLALKLLLLAGALTFVAGEILSRLTPMAPLLYVGSVWLGLLSIALAVFLPELLLSTVFPQQRRLFVLAALALVFVIGAYSVLNAALEPAWREVKIPVRGLAPEMEGFSIVQLSDLHLGNLTSPGRLRRIVDRTNAVKPDLICVTGDTLDGDICRDEGYCGILGQLRARYGVVAVTGNHEFYAGVEKFMELARRSRWRVLRNQSWVIDGKIALAGLEEDSAERFQLPGPARHPQGAAVSPAGPLQGSGGPWDRPPAVRPYTCRTDPAHGPAGLADLQVSRRPVPPGLFPHLYVPGDRHLGTADAIPVALGNDPAGPGGRGRRFRAGGK